MLDASFVREILQQSAAQLHTIEGEWQYADKPLHLVKLPEVEPIGVSTLTAMVDYCLRELDPDTGYLIHVRDFATVDLYSGLLLNTRQRERFITAFCAADMFRFGKFMPVEEFVIAMQAQFVQDDTTAAILALVGNIATEAKTTVEDDGVTQRITAKAGIVRTEDREVPNPVVLCPYRTFPEIEQPESRFVLRVNASGPQAALFEADGGAWKNNAIAGIAGFLQDRLSALIEKGQITILA